MNIITKQVNELIPYINNSRTHDDNQITQIMASINEYGFTNPILIDDKGMIIAGHGRIQASKRMGLKEVPCIVLEGLTDAQKKAYVIADNKLALNAGWDEELLSIEIEGLSELDYDLSLLGFSDDELDNLLGEENEVIEDDFDCEIPTEPKSKRGDVWTLGRHRLMCGDSTSADVDVLMNGNKADMVFTDPPYNVAFNGRSGKHDVIKNDNLKESEFDLFINNSINKIKELNPKAYYIWCNWNFYGILQKKLEYKSCIVWAKNVFGLGNGYRHQHEFCLYNGKIDEHIKNESDLWEIKKDTNYVHPTQKPVELSVRAFSNHITYLNVVDLFGGSGSTLIGAEQTGRNCFMMELDEKYIDVIIERYAQFKGSTEDITLIRDGQQYTYNDIYKEGE